MEKCIILKDITLQSIKGVTKIGQIPQLSKNCQTPSKSWSIAKRRKNILVMHPKLNGSSDHSSHSPKRNMLDVYKGFYSRSKTPINHGINGINLTLSITKTPKINDPRYNYSSSLTSNSKNKKLHLHQNKNKDSETFDILASKSPYKSCNHIKLEPLTARKKILNAFSEAKLTTIASYNALSIPGTNANGTTKINQDRAVFVSDFMGYKECALGIVCDGHGVNGHIVSDFIVYHLPSIRLYRHTPQ
jgi:hypothetical protein